MMRLCGFGNEILFAANAATEHTDGAGRPVGRSETGLVLQRVCARLKPNALDVLYPRSCWDRDIAPS